MVTRDALYSWRQGVALMEYRQGSRTAGGIDRSAPVREGIRFPPCYAALRGLGERCAGDLFRQHEQDSSHAKGDKNVKGEQIIPRIVVYPEKIPGWVQMHVCCSSSTSLSTRPAITRYPTRALVS